MFLDRLSVDEQSARIVSPDCVRNGGAMTGRRHDQEAGQSAVVPQTCCSASSCIWGNFGACDSCASLLFTLRISEQVCQKVPRTSCGYLGTIGIWLSWTAHSVPCKLRSVGSPGRKGGWLKPDLHCRKKAQMFVAVGKPCAAERDHGNANANISVPVLRPHCEIAYAASCGFRLCARPFTCVGHLSAVASQRVFGTRFQHQSISGSGGATSTLLSS